VGVPVVVSAPAIDESVSPGEAWSAYVERVVAAKLQAAAALLERAPGAHAACLVADTVVVVDGAILAKPADDDESVAMTLAIAGRAHEVSTRFAIALPAPPASAPTTHAETVTTRVFVRPLDEAWARRYAATREGRDKAGGYAIQGIFSAAVSRIEGSYTNVVGLPVAEVLAALAALGVLGPFPAPEGPV